MSNILQENVLQNSYLNACKSISYKIVISEIAKQCHNFSKTTFLVELGMS